MSFFPTGYTQAQAVQAVQDETNSNFGQPPVPTIIRFLNRAVEQMCARLDAPLTNVSIPVTVPNSNVFTIPADIWQLRNVSYSNGDPTVEGTTAYEMVLLPYDEFIQNTMSTPAGGLGGIPTIFTFIEDTANVITMQVYPLVSAGFINLYYYQRGMLWDPNNPNSTSNLDSVFQECVIWRACSSTMNFREMDDRAAKYLSRYTTELEEAKALSGKRKRKNQSNTVRDVTEGDSIFPIWMR